MREFNEKASEEYQFHRTNFRDCYTYIEDYCQIKFNSGNYLDLLAETTNLKEICRKEIIEIIKQDYVKSQSNNFNIRPIVKNATDFLRKEILGEDIEHKYKKSLERAVYELLKAIRDNITHQGKFEISENQYKRNEILIKNASLITCSLVQEIENNK